MRAHTCPTCHQVVFFENSVCVACGTALGFSVSDLRVVAVPTDGSAVVCANLGRASCQWLVPADEVGPWGGLCASCRLTRTRPADGDVVAHTSFVEAEVAKRRLVYQLLDLHLPVVPLAADPAGLAFDLLSSSFQPVTTGHADGVVTIDLAEGQDVHREALRVQLAEPYRTMLGHLRHETGHYYWARLVERDPQLLDRSRAVFGDERADYGTALQRHYAAGPAARWDDAYVSAYATAHPWEDWAETFAHYLHISDTIQTAAAFGLVVRGPAGAGLSAVPRDRPARGIDELVDTWLPLTYALNAVNKSMGKGDLYPFVLSERVVDKLELVHEIVTAPATV